MWLGSVSRSLRRERWIASICPTSFIRPPKIEFVLWCALQRSERKMSQTVAELLVGVLEQIDVKHIFGLIGDSLNPLAEAIQGSRIEWISVRIEGAAFAAAGPAKLTCQFAMRPVPTGPGSTHLVATTRLFWRFPAT